MRSFAAACSFLALHALASPLVRRNTTGVCPSEAAGDAPFSLPCSTYEDAITCPNGVTGKLGGVVLLVHGTSNTGQETWSQGPYVLLLPSAGSGFDVCWIDLPNRAMEDAQLSSEYVAHAIPYLASQSATTQISLIGHSQGTGINIPCALQFWPSSQKHVLAFVSLAGDFHGTAEGPFACLATDLTAGGCTAAIIQQTVGSHLLEAMNRNGNHAFVTTTSIYTIYDDVIQPEVGSDATSILPGVTNVYLQEESICGLLHVVGHFGIPADPAAYYLSVDALSNTSGASTSRFNPSSCNWLVSDTLKEQFSAIESVLEGVYEFVNSSITYPKVDAEPLLAAYVCAAGAASSYCVT